MFLPSRLSTPVFTSIALSSLLPAAHAQQVDDSATLAPITVKSSAQQEPVGYVAQDSVTATKTDTPIIEIPQSISVITEDQIREQGAQTLNQVLRYTSGVAPETRGAVASRLDQFNIRGFSATTLLDGMRIFGSRDALPQVDAYRLQRVDVLKGPSSVMFGQGGPGGVVNQISKRPTRERLNEVELQLGDRHYRRANVDFSGAVDQDEQWLYRLTGSVYKADGQIRETREERYFIAPALTWQPSADTRLTLLANFQRDPHMGSYGSLPGIRTRFDAPDGIRLDPDFYDGDADFETSDRRHQSIGYDFEHRFNPAVTVRSQARYLHAEGIYRSVYSSGYLPGSTDYRYLARRKGGTDVTMDSYTLDNHIQGRFATGALDHTVVAGFDFAHLQSDTLASSFDPAPPLDVFNPDYRQPIGPVNWTSKTNQRQYQTGLYLQDQIQIDKWSLLLGGRYDWSRTVSEARNLKNGVVTPSSTRATAFTGRVGLIYNFDNGLAPYFSYAESFEPQSGTDAQDRPFDPLRGQQYELGIKYQPPGTRALYSAALFDIRRQNMLTTIAGCVGSKCQEQTGEVRTQGLELEARSEFNNGLSLIANYSYIANEYTKDNANPNRPSMEGMTPYGIPKHQASVWARYQLQSGPLSGLGMAAGLRYRGTSYGGSHNDFKVPASTLVDMALDYDLGRASPTLKGMDLALNVSNLFNTRNISSCTSQDWCWYGYQRSVKASLRYRW